MGSFRPSRPNAEIRQGSFSYCLVVGRPKSGEGGVTFARNVGLVEIGVFGGPSAALLPIRSHRGLAKLGSFGTLAPTAPIPSGSGCVFNQSTRAAAVASIPVLFHHAASSPYRCTSR